MTLYSNKNAYTISIVGLPEGIESLKSAIETCMTRVVENLSRYIIWRGTLDFVTIWDSRVWNSENGFGAFGGINSQGRTYAEAESITGIDQNGNDFDLGTWVTASSLTKLTNYGVEVFIDPNPTPLITPELQGKHDFYSIFLHEVYHGLGDWSTSQHGLPPSTFDKLTQQIEGKWYFTGAVTKGFYGNNLPLASFGSRDHFSDSIPQIYDLSREYGYYGKRWSITGLELAVLKDLGYQLTEEGNAVVNKDKTYAITNTYAKDRLSAILTGTPSINQKFDETKFFSMGNNRYGVQQKGKSTIDEITGVSTLSFNDKTVSVAIDVQSVFDKITGKETQDAMMYRLYNAAFARFPDADGLKYWINSYSSGAIDYKQVAQSFLSSPEFASKYGVNNSNNDFVNNLYRNILGRSPDSSGLQFWVNTLNRGVSSRADVLGGFSESPENKNLFSQTTGFT